MGLSTIQFLHVYLLDFHQVLEFHLIRLIPSIREGIFVVSYMLLLNNRCEKIGFRSSSTLIICHWNLFWHFFRRI